MDKQKDPFLKEIPYMYRILHSPFVEKLLSNRRTLAIGASGLVLTIVGLVFTFSSLQHKQIKNISLAKSYVEDLQDQSEEKTRESFAKLLQLARKDRVIGKRYAGILAQELLVQGKFQEARPFVNHSIEFLKKSNLSAYTQFSEIAALTAKGELQKALDTTLHLKKSLHKKSRDSLYLFVLFQESALLEALHRKDDALKIQDEIKTYLQEKQDPDLSEHFQENQASLLN